MPLYEYECEICGVRFERRQSVTDDPLRVCPECGGRVHRLIQTAGIIFRGKGFYVTDNKKARSSAVASKGRGSRKRSARAAHS